MTSQQLQNLLPNITITEQQIQHYVIRKPAASPTQMEASPTSTPTPATASPAPMSTSTVSPAQLPTSPAHSQSSEGSFMSAEDTAAADAERKEEVGQVRGITFLFVPLRSCHQRTLD